MGNAYLYSILATASIFTLLALSLNIITGYAGQAMMGIAAFFGIGAYTAAICTTHGIPFFAALLIGSGVKLEKVGYVDGISPRPVERAHHLLGNIVPCCVSLQVRVSVRKQNYLVPTQQPKLLRLQLKQAARCQPYVLGIEFGEDHSRFLGFYDADCSCIAGEVTSEEHMSGLEGVLRQTEAFLHQVHCPGGVAILQPMTVGAVPHQLAVVNTADLVDLPVDYGIVY